WDELTVERFRIAEEDRNRENSYYAPYNRLLSIVFPPNSRYTVEPVIHPIGTRKTIEYMVTMQLGHKIFPVLVVEIKSPDSLQSLSARREANEQIANRYASIGNQCPLEIFYAISAFGTMISIYTLDRSSGTIAPSYPPADHQRLNDNVPEDAWNIDILEENGANTINEVFTDVQRMCE
ncbi:hypothetical protein K450DRAFT_166908, partial [Umbelopsis ramanniana AG]